MKQELSGSEERLIHIKFDYNEAIESKKDILESEKNFIKMIRFIQNYQSLRNQELKLRLKLYKKFREINFRLKKLQISLPQIKVPKGVVPKKTISNIKMANPRYNDSLESELREIQKKLNSLQQQNL